MSNLHVDISIRQTLYGSNCKDIRRKNKGHCKKSSTCTLLKKAIDKYGIANMKTEVLLECKVEDADMYEQTMIQAYNCIAPFGYNADNGGNSNKTRSDETKKKIAASMSKYMKEKWASIPKEERSRIMQEKADTRSLETKAKFRSSMLRLGKQVSTGSITTYTKRYGAQVSKSMSLIGKKEIVAYFKTREEAEEFLQKYKTDQDFARKVHEERKMKREERLQKKRKNEDDFDSILTRNNKK